MKRAISQARLNQLQRVGATIQRAPVVVPTPPAPPPPPPTAPTIDTANLEALLERYLTAMLNLQPEAPAAPAAPIVRVDLSRLEALLATKRTPKITMMKMRNITFSQDRIATVDIAIESELV